MPSVEAPKSVYSLIGKEKPVSFLVKWIKNNMPAPKIALLNKNLNGLRLLNAKIKIMIYIIHNNTITPYFKKFIISPNYRYEFFKIKRHTFIKKTVPKKIIWDGIFYLILTCRRNVAFFGNFIKIVYRFKHNIFILINDFFNYKNNKENY